MPQFLRRLGSLTPRCRNSAPVVPFSLDSTDAASSPPTTAAESDDLKYGSPTAKGRVQAFAGSPLGSAKKPRLCHSEDNPHTVAATPTSSSKKQRLSEDRSAGGFLGSASPMSNSSKKPRLSPLNHTPRVATSPPQNANRRLCDQSPTMGAMTPAESPPAPEESPPPPAMNSGMRNSASTPCRPPVLPPNVGELPAYPKFSLNLQGISSAENAQPRKHLEFENVEMNEEEKAPIDVRASAPASLFTTPAASATASPPQAESQPKRPQTARPPARPLSGFLSGVVGRLMSPRRMMSPARVNSPRRDPLPPAPNLAAADPGKASGVSTPQDPSSASSKRSRGWFPSPRRRETTSSKPAAEPGKEGAAVQTAVQTPRARDADLQRREGAAVAADPVEALVQPMLSAVYGRALTNNEISAATSACPEITWLAQCAILCPLPVGWVAIPAEEATGAPALYACELTGEVVEQPPHLPRFSKLARLLMHAVTHPAEASTAVAWLRVEIDDANAECIRLQESWCRSIDPSSGSEFWHNPMTGKSSWESPAAPSAFAAAVAERVLDTEPFKAVRAREALQSRGGPMTPRPPQEARAKSQSAPSSRQRAGSRHAAVSSARGNRTESLDTVEQHKVQSARRRSAHEQRSRDTPSSARCERLDTNYGEETPCRRRVSNDNRSRQSLGSARGRRGEIFDLYEEEMRSSRRKEPAEQKMKQSRAPSNRGEVFDLFEETPTRKRSSQRHNREASSSENDEESADPEIFNMATPPRNEWSSSQANSTDAVTALAGAAAALATAAAALSARGPPKDESMDTSSMASSTAIPMVKQIIEMPALVQEISREAVPEVCLMGKEASANQSPAKAPDTSRMLQFSEIQPAPTFSVPSSNALPQQAEPATPLAASNLAPPPPPPPPKPRAKTPAPPPAAELPQDGLEAAIHSAARTSSSSCDSECEHERKQVLQEVDSILSSARGSGKPKPVQTAALQAESSFSLSIPSMPEQTKIATSDSEPHDVSDKVQKTPDPKSVPSSIPSMPLQAKKATTSVANDKVQKASDPKSLPSSIPSTPLQAKAATSEVESQEKLQSVLESSPKTPCVEKKLNSIPKVKLPSSLPTSVAITGKSVPGIPVAVTSSCSES